MLRTLLAGAALAAALPPAAASAAVKPTYVDAGSLAQSAPAATLDELQALGVRALRVTLVWRSVAPAAFDARRPAFDATDPAGYDWKGYGALVDAARARGMRVLITFSAPAPRWATAARKDFVTRPRPAEFEAFATAVGRRFGDGVGAWGLWNEPNHPRFLQPQVTRGRPASPAIYRALHAAGVRGLAAAGQGPDVMLAGETAPGGDRRRAVPPLQFLRGVRCRGCAPLRIDAWAHHPYANRKGPFHVPPDRDNVTIGVLRRLHAQLDRSGLRRVPVWITEFGVQSTPDRTLGVPLAQQAEFRSIAERIAALDGRVAAFGQYLLRDDVATAGFQSGLLWHDGRRKPAYDEFRTPLVARRAGRTAELWGAVRPASGATRVEVLAGGSVLAVRPTDAHGVWTARLAVRPGRVWRVRWTDDAGRTYVGPPVRAYGLPH